MSIFTKGFWKATAERTIGTAAQTAVSLLTVDGLGIMDVDWQQTGSVTLLAALLALLKCVGAAKISGGASLTDAEQVSSHG